MQKSKASLRMMLVPDMCQAKQAQQGTLHVLAALKHHFVDRDDTLKRILPGKRV